MKRSKSTIERITIGEGAEALSVTVTCDGDGVPIEVEASRAAYGSTGATPLFTGRAEHLERLAALVADIRRDARGYSYKTLVCADHGYQTRTNGYECPVCKPETLTDESAPPRVA
jgi:hypothetical protein